MTSPKTNPVYRKLVIVASSQTTDIWLGDDDGHLVQKETGMLETRVMEGQYTVEFGLGTRTYPIHVTENAQYTEAQLDEGPTCPRPIPNIEQEEESGHSLT